MDNSQRLVDVFAESLNIEKDEVKDSLEYNSIEEWDSVAHMALVAALEIEFDVMLDTEDIIGMSSVKVAKEILSKHEVKF